MNIVDLSKSRIYPTFRRNHTQNMESQGCTFVSSYISIMAQQIFINLPVRDLNKSVAFFTELGFKFNPQFTDENGTCMVISDTIFVMLLVEKFFTTFTRKAIADSRRSTEVILALSSESRDHVDELVDNAVRAGGQAPGATQDQGWMYGRSFEDIDGHLWEIVWMQQQ